MLGEGSLPRVAQAVVTADGSELTPAKYDSLVWTVEPETTAVLQAQRLQMLHLHTGKAFKTLHSFCAVLDVPFRY